MSRDVPPSPASSEQAEAARALADRIWSLVRDEGAPATVMLTALAIMLGRVIGVHAKPGKVESLVVQTTALVADIARMANRIANTK